jgi:hypothetical protein
LAVNFVLNGNSTFLRLSALQQGVELESPATALLRIDTRGAALLVSATARSGLAGEALDLLAGELGILFGGTIRNARLLEQEISDARNFLRGSLLRRTETTPQLARFILWSEWNGFPGFGVSDHLAMINSIDKDTLLETIETHFDPSSTGIVAVGPARRLRGALERIGEVEVITP